MFIQFLIGHLGADAEVKSANGKDFVTFRIANSEKWTDEAGNVHELTTWVDCIINGKPKVFDFLKKGQLVFVSGYVSLRVYSSAKDKCMKAGMTINVRQIELLGGKSDDVPSTLFTEDGKQQVNVGKYFYSERPKVKGKVNEKRILISKSGERFEQDPDGWIKREVTNAK